MKMQRVKVAEWWEVWIEPPGQSPVRCDRYGMAIDVRVPREGFPTREYAEEAARGNRFARIIRVVRYRLKKS